jgi:hypothetical protein
MRESAPEAEPQPEIEACDAGEGPEPAKLPPRGWLTALMEAGYATPRALNMSDIEYEMTEAGRKALDVRTRP